MFRSSSESQRQGPDTPHPAEEMIAADSNRRGEKEQLPSLDERSGGISQPTPLKGRREKHGKIPLSLPTE